MFYETCIRWDLSVPCRQTETGTTYTSKIKITLAFRNYLANSGAKMFKNVYASSKIELCNQGMLDGRARLCL